MNNFIPPSSKDLVINTLLIKQMKLLPSPIKTREKKSGAYTPLQKNRNRTYSNVSQSAKNPHTTTDINMKDLLPTELSTDKPSVIDQSQSSLPHLEEIEEPSERVTLFRNKKSKKTYGSLNLTKQNDEEADQEVYAQKDDFIDCTIDELEKRVAEWLDGKNIVIRDPMEKKDEYYQRKKNMVIKSSHNSPIKQECETDCNSPALNLSINSGLLMKRKMKSTTIVDCDQRFEKHLSKFSQN